VPVVAYNPRNTGGPLDINYRVEDRITEFTEDVMLKRLILAETYKQLTSRLSFAKSWTDEFLRSRLQFFS